MIWWSFCFAFVRCLFWNFPTALISGLCKDLQNRGFIGKTIREAGERMTIYSCYNVWDNKNWLVSYLALHNSSPDVSYCVQFSFTISGCGTRSLCDFYFKCMLVWLTAGVRLRHHVQTYLRTQSLKPHAAEFPL